MSSIPENRLTLTVQELLAATGLSRTTLYNEMSAGRLLARKIGARVLFRHADVVAWLDGLPAAKIHMSGADEAPPPVSNRRRKYAPSLPDALPASAIMARPRRLGAGA